MAECGEAGECGGSIPVSVFVGFSALSADFGQLVADCANGGRPLPQVLLFEQLCGTPVLPSMMTSASVGVIEDVEFRRRSCPAIESGASSGASGLNSLFPVPAVRQSSGFGQILSNIHIRKSGYVVRRCGRLRKKSDEPNHSAPGQRCQSGFVYRNHSSSRARGKARAGSRCL